MDFLQLAAGRYSVRSFSDRPIEPEKGKNGKIFESRTACSYSGQFSAAEDLSLSKSSFKANTGSLNVPGNLLQTTISLVIRMLKKT